MQGINAETLTTDDGEKVTDKAKYKSSVITLSLLLSMRKLYFGDRWQIFSKNIFVHTRKSIGNLRMWWDGGNGRGDDV